MSRFKSAVHNIGHHAVSGLSNFLQDAYETCEENNIWFLKVDLLSGQCNLSSSMNSHKSLNNTVAVLKEKYESILLNTSGVELKEVKLAVVEIDFPVNNKEYKTHKKALENTGIWYGHDPLYSLTVSVQLENGQQYQEIFSSKNT